MKDSSIEEDIPFLAKLKDVLYFFCFNIYTIFNSAAKTTFITLPIPINTSLNRAMLRHSWQTFTCISSNMYGLLLEHLILPQEKHEHNCPVVSASSLICQ